MGREVLPDPKALISGLHDRHAKFMISVWPNPHGKAGDAITAAKGFINNSVYDATHPDIRALRWKLLDEAFFSIGTDAWWQDAAEPLDDGNSMEGSKTFLGEGSLWRNAYPLFHSQCLYEGQRAADPGKRVCNLTRSAYLGQQRYGTIAWSGDITGDWITFRRQIPAGLNLCMAGIPYWTTDCGGFFRPSDQYQSPDYNELQARWFEWSTFCPILRIHGYKTKTEFWNWLPETQRILADYDAFRYRMLPYTYAVAWQVTSAGSTMMRALALDFRDDPKALAVDDEYLFGPSLLVAPSPRPRPANAMSTFRRVRTGLISGQASLIREGQRFALRPRWRKSRSSPGPGASFRSARRWSGATRNHAIPPSSGSIPEPTVPSPSTRTPATATTTRRGACRDPDHLERGRTQTHDRGPSGILSGHAGQENLPHRLGRSRPWNGHDRGQARSGPLL